MFKTCPNCGRKGVLTSKKHIGSGCALAMVAGAAMDRENLTDHQIADRIGNADVDLLWDLMGPIVDKFEDGNL